MMYKLPGLLSLLFTEHLLEPGQIRIDQLLHSFHFAHDVFQRVALDTRDRTQHLDRSCILDLWSDALQLQALQRGSRRSLQDRSQLVGLVVVQLEVGKDADGFVGRRRPDDPQAREVQREKDELGLEVEYVPGIFFWLVATG